MTALDCEFLNNPRPHRHEKIAHVAHRMHAAGLSCPCEKTAGRIALLIAYKGLNAHSPTVPWLNALMKEVKAAIKMEDESIPYPYGHEVQLFNPHELTTLAWGHAYTPDDPPAPCPESLRTLLDRGSELKFLRASSRGLRSLSTTPGSSTPGPSTLAVGPSAVPAQFLENVQYMMGQSFMNLFQQLANPMGGTGVNVQMCRPARSRLRQRQARPQIQCYTEHLSRNPNFLNHINKSPHVATVQFAP